MAIVRQYEAPHRYLNSTSAIRRMAALPTNAIVQHTQIRNFACDNLDIFGRYYTGGPAADAATDAVQMPNGDAASVCNDCDTKQM